MTDVLRVWTEDNEVVMIGASADDDALLDAFARANERGVPLKVFAVSFERMQTIQALAESVEYEARWHLSLTQPTVDLHLTEWSS